MLLCAEAGILSSGGCKGAVQVQPAGDGRCSPPCRHVWLQVSRALRLHCSACCKHECHASITCHQPCVWLPHVALCLSFMQLCVALHANLLAAVTFMLATSCLQRSCLQTRLQPSCLQTLQLLTVSSNIASRSTVTAVVLSKKWLTSNCRNVLRCAHKQIYKTRGLADNIACLQGWT